MDQCEWKEIRPKDWKFEANNKTIALHVLFLPYNSDETEKNKTSTHFKHNLNHQN